MANYVYCPRVSATGSIAYNKGAMLTIVQIVDRIGENVEIKSPRFGYLGTVHKEDIFILPSSGKINPQLEVKLTKRVAEHKLQKRHSLNGADMRETATRGEGKVFQDNAAENPRPEGVRPETKPYKIQEKFRYSANDEAEALALRKMKSYGPSKIGKFQAKCAATKAAIIGDDVAEESFRADMKNMDYLLKKEN